MRVTFWLSFIGLLVGGLVLAQDSNTRLLTGFEDEADLHQWQCHNASAVRSQQHATQG